MPGKSKAQYERGRGGCVDVVAVAEIIKSAFLPFQSHLVWSLFLATLMLFALPDDQQLTLGPLFSQPGILGPAVKQTVVLAVQVGTKLEGAVSGSGSGSIATRSHGFV